MNRQHISCEGCRTAVSARLDGEDPGAPSVAVHAHLARCAECRAFESDVASLHRALRVTAAPHVPDLTSRIMASVDAAFTGPMPADDALR